MGLEEYVEFKIDKFDFRGYIDQVLEDADGEIIIVDHKSKAQFKSKAEQKEYARQLYLYAIPIFEKYGKYPKSLVFNMFRKQKVVTIDFKTEDLEEAKEWALKTIKEITETNIFAPTTDEFLCSSLCEFRYEDEHMNGTPALLEEYYPKYVWKRSNRTVEFDTLD